MVNRARDDAKFSSLHIWSKHLWSDLSVFKWHLTPFCACAAIWFLIRRNSVQSCEACENSNTDIEDLLSHQWKINIFYNGIFFVLSWIPSRIRWQSYRLAWKGQAYLMQKKKMQRQTSARAEWLTTVASVSRWLLDGILSRNLFHLWTLN